MSEPDDGSEHLIGMSTLAAVCIEERALQEEYKVALQAWTEARNAYPIKIVSPEILKATKHLDAIELKLKNHRAEHGC